MGERGGANAPYVVCCYTICDPAAVLGDVSTVIYGQANTKIQRRMENQTQKSDFDLPVITVEASETLFSICKMLERQRVAEMDNTLQPGRLQELIKGSKTFFHSRLVVRNPVCNSSNTRPNLDQTHVLQNT